MVGWRLVFTREARKDARKIAQAGLRPKTEKLLRALSVNPFQNPPGYEKLIGDLAGAYSRRITIHHSSREGRCCAVSGPMTF
ncbi:MAG: type II toxin-antitoxin system mRNA interferase toxin, RelE/StbE family [Candidatus Omnitrophica bacterium]|nr:type II toxin-antitoxin system mRNA interferase toxin, RelE/StbE family [Candidatus Omnitrophota bacterium]